MKRCFYRILTGVNMKGQIISFPMSIQSNRELFPLCQAVSQLQDFLPDSLHAYGADTDKPLFH